MVDAQHVQHRGPEIVNGGDLVDRPISEFVGLAVGDAAFVAPAGRFVFGLLFDASQ